MGCDMGHFKKCTAAWYDVIEDLDMLFSYMAFPFCFFGCLFSPIALFGLGFRGWWMAASLVSVFYLFISGPYLIKAMGGYFKNSYDEVNKEGDK